MAPGYDKATCAQANLGLAQMYQKLGRPQYAAAAYKQAATLAPERSDSYDGLGALYLTLKRYPEAVAAYQQALRVNKDDAQAHGQLILAYLLSGQQDRARQELAPGLSNAPQNGLVLTPQQSEQLFDFLLDTAERGKDAISISAFYSFRVLGANSYVAFRRFPELFALGLQWVESDDPERQRPALLMIFDLGYKVPKTLASVLTAERRASLLPHLLAGLEDPHPGARIPFIEALGYLRERTAVPRLIQFLQDEHPALRLHAARALGHIGDERALPALEKVAANDPAQNEGRFYVRDQARKAIEEIRTSVAR
jgi:tetratricopeptide (TPR) repeat protein